MIAAFVVKSTLVLAVALLLVAVLQRSRASLRHLVLYGTFGFLFLLPIVQAVAPAWTIRVDKEPIAAAIAALPGAPQSHHVERVVSAPVAEVARLQLLPLLGGVYLAGAAVLGLSLLIGVVRLRRLAETAEVWLEGASHMNEIALSANIRRPALVVLSEHVDVPLTFGFRRSTIVLPAVARTWSAEELTRALRHELEHVHREDWALQLLARAVCAVYWPNPMVWFAWRRFCIEAERACDDAVVGSSNAEDYAEQLVMLARGARRMSALPALSMASRSKLALRVRAILDASQDRGPHGRLATTGVLTVFLALLIGLAPAQIIAAAADRMQAELSGAMPIKADSVDPVGDIGAVEEVEDSDDVPDVDAVDHSDAVADGVADGVSDGIADGMATGVAEGIAESIAEGVDGSIEEAFVEAAKDGELDLVRRFLDDGIDVNTIVPGDGTALIAAAGAGHRDVVEFLLRRRAHVNLAVIGEGSPLIAAARGGHLRVVHLLLARGASIDQIVPEDETALMQAAREGNTEVARLLIQRGADVNLTAVTRGGEVRSALSMARRSASFEIEQLLLDAGARR
jgi:beta-lactamase regulating signal transducer with metallopeptidase domain